MESFFQFLGFSWTWSKSLPYIVLFIFGLMMYRILLKRVKFKGSQIVLSLIIIIPVGTYFAVNPIYSGDFSNNYREVTEIPSSLNFSKKSLTVVAIPNCPYCAEAIGRLNKIAERTNVDSIYFKVLTSDTSMLASYTELASSHVKVSNELNFDEFEAITQGRYPTFIYRKNRSAHIWSNDGFGVRAIDWVENEISN